MWRLILVLLMLCGAAHATSACLPTESSKSDLRRATAIVRRLPELASWIHSDSPIVFDTGSREKIKGWCYETVFVYAINPDHDLDLRYVFAVHPTTGATFVEDMPTSEFIPLKKWRARTVHGNKP